MKRKLIIISAAGAAWVASNAFGAILAKVVGWQEKGEPHERKMYRLP